MQQFLLFLIRAIVHPTRFVSKAALGAAWGFALYPGEVDVTYQWGFTALAAVLAVVLYMVPLWWLGVFDGKGPASKVSLHGLVLVGEGFGVGAISLAFLGAYTGVVDTAGMILCSFCAALATVYGALQLRHEDEHSDNNTKKAAGSND